MCSDIGDNARIAIDTALPFDANSFWLEFDSEGIVKTNEIVRPNGIRGTRMREAGNAALGVSTVSGSLSFTVTKNVMAAFGAAILGTTGTVVVADTPYEFAESLPSFYMLIDKRTEIVLVSGAKVNTAEFTASQNGMLKLNLTIEAEDMVGGQVWPVTLIQPDQSKPYVFSDANDVPVNSVARSFFGHTTRVNNFLTADQYANSLNRTGRICPTDQEITLGLDFAATPDNVDLQLHSGEVGIAGEAITVTYVSNNESGSELKFVHGNTVFNGTQPVVNTKGPVRFRVEGQSSGLNHPGVAGHVPSLKIINTFT